ncbi:MAG: signal peptidase I, partial [Armatimonadetes bacterium]|nr:signal peptidase I [Armatimonadota bacterium]
VKRVIGVEGDWVVIVEGQVWVNGQPLDEPYAVWRQNTRWRGRPFQARVGKGEVFVLGDNRDFSEDSRDFGTVPLDRILGRGERIIYPKNRRRKL